MSSGPSLIHSARWASVAQVSKILGQVVSVAVLSRLLPPSAYGVIAMASVVTSLVGLLRDMGTGTAVIQRRELTPEFTDTVFWMNVVLGAVLALVLIGAAPWIADYFHEPQLLGVLMVLALMFPLGSMTTVHQALIERRSEFKSLAMLDVMNQTLGLVTAIVAALCGLGVYSFVLPSVVTTVVGSAWLWRRARWTPGLRWSSAAFKSLWGFTGHLTLFNFVNYFGRNADSMIIGRMLGSTQLGQYSMGYKLMLFPVQNISWVINRIMLPKLSRLQERPEAAADLYLRVLSQVITITAPLMLGLWAARESFVAVVLGERWAALVPLLAWLAPIGLIQSMTSTTGPVFMSTGRTDVMFKLGLASTVLFVVAFIVGAHWGGIEGVVMAYAVANAVNVTVVALSMNRLMPLGLAGLRRHLGPPLLSALAMAVVMVEIDLWLAAQSAHPVVRLACAGVVGLGVYLGLLKLVFRRDFDALRQLVNLTPKASTE